ncbi:Myosin-J heavy chain (Myosin-5b) [Durusdinium trenchii]|uniref:Myosin-J heavy chain (Myosin-5b) n=1 Tax=Durusdinium trenchii TaxID=1381693 RepID=A0ABP0L8N9_9DINO
MPKKTPPRKIPAKKVNLPSRKKAPVKGKKKKTKAQQKTECVQKVMRFTMEQRKRGTLRTRAGYKPASRDQALAIGYERANATCGKTPRRKGPKPRSDLTRLRVTWFFLGVGAVVVAALLIWAATKEDPAKKDTGSEPVTPSPPPPPGGGDTGEESGGIPAWLVGGIVGGLVLLAVGAYFFVKRGSEIERFKRENRELHQAVVEAQDSLSESRDAFQRENRAVGRLRIRANEATAKSEELGQRIAALEEKNERLNGIRDTRNELQETVDKLTDDNAKLDMLLKEEKETLRLQLVVEEQLGIYVTEQEAEIERLQQANANQSQAVTQASGTKRELEKKIAKMQAENEKVREQLSEMETQMQDREKEVQARFSQAEQIVGDARREKQRDWRERQGFKDELNATNLQIKDLTRRVEARDRQIEGLRQALQREQKGAEDVQRAKDELNDMKGQFKDAVEEGTRQLATFKEKVQNLSVKLSSTKKELGEAKRQLRNMEAERNELQGKLGRARTRKQKADETARALQERLRAKEVEINRLGRETRNLRIDLKEAQQQAYDKDFPEGGRGGLDMWTVYLLQCQRTTRTYIGATNNFERRIRQHNGEIKGGARYTTAQNLGVPGHWAAKVLVQVPDKSTALSVEYRAKRRGRTVISGVRPRRERLLELAAETESAEVLLDALAAPPPRSPTEPRGSPDSRPTATAPCSSPGGAAAA